jgi:hypothetical protein
MNMSGLEQRVRHALAPGGAIRHEGLNGRITAAPCLDRERPILAACTLPLFQRLRRRGLIESRGGAPCRIAALGRQAVRAQLDNRRA